jgi:hypothetical protein
MLGLYSCAAALALSISALVFGYLSNFLEIGALYKEFGERTFLGAGIVLSSSSMSSVSLSNESNLEYDEAGIAVPRDGIADPRDVLGAVDAAGAAGTVDEAGAVERVDVVEASLPAAFD